MDLLKINFENSNNYFKELSFKLLPELQVNKDLKHKYNEAFTLKDSNKMIIIKEDNFNNSNNSEEKRDTVQDLIYDINNFNDTLKSSQKKNYDKANDFLNTTEETITQTNNVINKSNNNSCKEINSSKNYKNLTSPIKKRMNTEKFKKNFDKSSSIISKNKIKDATESIKRSKSIFKSFQFQKPEIFKENQSESKSPSNNLINSEKNNITELPNLLISSFDKLERINTELNNKNNLALAASNKLCLDILKKDYIFNSLAYPSTKKILLVDDNKQILSSHEKLFQSFLKKNKLESKYMILICNDGIEALYAIYRDSIFFDGSIKLIISDEMMNYMNGTELFNLSKKLIFTNKKIPPFVICSAFCNEAHFDKLRDNNIESISKPLSKNNVSQLFEKYLGLKA